MRLQAIIFDFDGVLADSERLHLRAFQDVLGQAGVRLTEHDYYGRYLGLADADVFESFARDETMPLTRPQLAELLALKAARYQALITEAPVIYPGVAERVRDWSRHVMLAIVSGARRSEIDAILATAGLGGCFTAIVSAEDVARGKPAPDGYQLALHRLGAPDAADCVVIEDTVFGLEAARSAGTRTVAVTTNYPADRLTTADLIVPSVASLDLPTLAALTRGRD